MSSITNRAPIPLAGKHRLDTSSVQRLHARRDLRVEILPRRLEAAGVDLTYLFEVVVDDPQQPAGGGVTAFGGLMHGRDVGSPLPCRDAGAHRNSTPGT